MTCPNHANLRLLTVAKRGSLEPTRSLILLCSVVGPVLQVGDAEKFPRALGFEGLDIFLTVSKQSPRFTAVEEDGGDKRLVEIELACETDGAASPVPV